MNYKNPIIYADYSDPDVLRINDDYFMVASSFSNTPILPILHSKDLVNWEIVNYISDRLPFDYYEFPMHGCGVWAPSIREHNGTFYCFVPFPDEGIFVYKTQDIYGEWSEPHCLVNSAGWIDPCPLFDEDGRVYMVNAFAKSRIGFKEMLHVCELSPDCTEVIDTGHFVFDGTYTEPTIEGPKFYKRNGFYYIFAPSGGVKNGWQVVLRSKNVYGPYEIRRVLVQGSSDTNGPHQGAWIDTPYGEDWFIHFQDVENGGRIVHLQPLKWIEDWPIIGKPISDICGEAVAEFTSPKAETFDILPFDYTTMIKDGKLNLNWQWNANYSDDWYFALNDCLCLKAMNFTDKALEFEKKMEQALKLNTLGQDFRFSIAADKALICNRPNLLTLKQPSEMPNMTIKFDLQNLMAGDSVGFGVLGDAYSFVCVKKTEEGIKVQKITGNRMVAGVDEKGKAKISNGAEEIDYNASYEENTISITLNYTDREHVQYSYNGIDIPVKSLVSPGRWVGAKIFMFAENSNKVSKGYVKVLKLDRKR